MKEKIRLNNLGAPIGANKRRKIVGRGVGSGHGKTSGKGHKGEKARSGGNIRPGFEGGQMSLIRRLPKFGFSPLHKEKVQLVNIESLNKFKDNEVVTPEALVQKGFIKSAEKLTKILGDGELKKILTVKSDRFSNKAIEKITSIGGKALDRKDVAVSVKVKVKPVPKPKIASEKKAESIGQDASLKEKKQEKKEEKKDKPAGSDKHPGKQPPSQSKPKGK